MSDDAPPTVTTEEDGQAVKDGRKIKRLQEVEDMRAVMSAPAGRRFVHRMLGLCGTFRLSFAGEQTHATAFNEGKRSVGNQLFAELEAVSPAQFLDMLREAQQPKKSV